MDPSVFASSTSSSIDPRGSLDSASYLDFDNEFDLDFTGASNDLTEEFPDPGNAFDDGEGGEKRKNSDDSDDEESGSKRREGEEKTSKKPGRKPLTSEPTTVSSIFIHNT